MSDHAIIHQLLQGEPNYGDHDAATLAAMISEYILGWRMAEAGPDIMRAG